MFFTSASYAECTTNAHGKVVCGNGDKAVGYNSKTGTAYKAETNQAGVKTIENSRGGKLKTKNGVAVYKGPNGTTCVKAPNNKGCR